MLTIQYLMFWRCRCCFIFIFSSFQAWQAPWAALSDSTPLEALAQERGQSAETKWDKTWNSHKSCENIWFQNYGPGLLHRVPRHHGHGWRLLNSGMVKKCGHICISLKFNSYHPGHFLRQALRGWEGVRVPEDQAEALHEGKWLFDLP